jgi:nucleoside-diphosphate-sugar epimerase
LRVLITGTDGYIGCILAPLLIERGYEVVGLDTRYYHEALLGAAPDTSFPRIDKDLRHVGPEDLQGCDAVLHLAGLSNDALGQISSEVTHEINHVAAVRLAQLARDAGVTRFVYSSSCSVYGKSDADVVDERSPVDPKTDYALCKVLDEREIGALAGDSFSPTFLRNATAYGVSPRMRFDLVVNQLAALAWTRRKIALVSDGTPWRPLVHIRDISQAFVAALEAPREAVHNVVFNVGSTSANYQIREIATAVAEAFPGCELSFGSSDPDQRSYRVSFEKIAGQLPGFYCRWNLHRGVTELREFFEGVHLTEEQFAFRAFTRLRQLKHLIDDGQIDDRFFWTRA